jgi:RNA polymerase sigma factor for flagellar operon FliA
VIVEDPRHDSSDFPSKQLLADTIARLAEQERLVVSLYYYEHLPLDEVGNILGLPESEVGKILERGREQVRAWIQEEPAKAPRD